MQNVQNNPPASSSSGMNGVLLTLAILVLLALGVWWFTSRSPGIPQTGDTNNEAGLDVDVNATVPYGSGQAPAPNE